MAQGYPPPQYDQQNGYPPYGQNPYAQQQPPQQPQQYGYGGPSPYPPQPQPYGQSPYPQLQPQPQPALPPCPEEAGGGRRFLAIVLDLALALSLGFAAAVATDKAREAHPAVHAVGHAATQHSGLGVVPFWAAFLGVGLLLSFVNQVLFTRLTGFSAGKGILAMRVVRSKGVLRPDTWRLTRRWLLGFVYLAVMFLDEDFEVTEGDVVGMRSVRWKHLREYQQAVARLG